MSSHFEIRFDHSEGALLRCLGLIQRRGYGVTEMAMRADPDGPVLTAAIEANGRSVETLARQIERLHDVRRVRNHADALPQHSLADAMRAFSRFLPILSRRLQPATEMGR
ncbi:MAG: ACT domain-containing protein [Pseudomonadota bacterium]